MHQTLTIIRDAIQFYEFDHDGNLPGAAKDSATFKSELAPYLRNDFPENPFEDNGKKADVVKIRDKAELLVDHVGGDEGWLYDNKSDEFIANTDSLTCDGITTYSQL